MSVELRLASQSLNPLRRQTLLLAEAECERRGSIRIELSNDRRGNGNVQAQTSMMCSLAFYCGQAGSINARRRSGFCRARSATLISWVSR